MATNSRVRAQTPKLSAGEIAEHLDARLIGDPELVLTSIAPIQTAGPGSITFLSDRKYVAELAHTAASAIVLQAEFEEATDATRLVAVSYTHLTLPTILRV